MKYNPNIHRRQSIRLRGYDYTNPGAYLITLCVQDRELLLGEIKDREMVLSTFGKIAQNHWQRIPRFFPHTDLDEYQIMPNHLHGIIIIKKRAGTTAARQNSSRSGNETLGSQPSDESFSTGTVPGSIGAIVQNYCSVTTRKINEIRQQPGSKFWQWDYYDHIIRGPKEFQRIRQYIRDNPANWNQDRYFKE